MSRQFHRLLGLRAALLCWFLLSGTAFGEEPFERLVLTPPRVPGPHEALWLTLTVGSLERGTELLVSVEDGEILGAVSPFGATPTPQPQAYTFALPKRAATDRVVKLRVQARDANGSLRAPREDEIINASLIYVPVSE